MSDDPWFAVLTDDRASSASRRSVIEAMRAALEGGDAEACGRALGVVVRVGMVATELRHDLVRLWRGPQRKAFQIPLINALSRLREVPPLIEVLRDGSLVRSVRQYVASALCRIGPAAAAAAPALVETLRDDDSRYEEIRALKGIGPAAIPDLLAGLSDKSDALRTRVLRALGFIGPAARDALFAVVNALADPASMVREQAAFALGCLKPLPQTAVLALARTLKDEDESVRREAIRTLHDLGPDAAAAAPQMVSLLAADDPDERAEMDDRIGILDALAAVGPAAAEVAGPVVRAILADARASARERSAAAVAVWRISGDATTAAAALREMARMEMLPERRARSEAGDASNVIWENEERMAADRRRAARQALFRMGVAGGDCTEFLVAGLTDVDVESRIQAALAAPDVAADRNVVVPILSKLLDEPDSPTRWQAIKTLLRMGVTSPEIGASIRAAEERDATSWDMGRCMEAIDLIPVLGPSATPLIPTLEHVRDHYPELRPKSILALAHVKGDVASAIPGLVADLTDTDWTARRQTAAECLGKIGPAARVALPDLERAARFGEHYWDRKYALDAIRCIDSKTADDIQETFS